MDGIMFLIGVVEFFGIVPGFIAGASLATIFNPGQKFGGVIMALIMIGLMIWWVAAFPAPHSWWAFGIAALAGLLGKGH